MIDLEIREAALQDAGRLLEIYAPYVERTAVSFEYDVPTVEEFRRRIEQTTQRYPYLVALAGGRIVGYAYAGQFHSRAAYRFSAELSVYVDRDMRGRGIGRALYAELEERLRQMGVLNLYACIAYNDDDDEFLTKDSVYFHEKMGYRLIGRFNQCGCKFGRWYDIVYMEKIIGSHIND